MAISAEQKHLLEVMRRDNAAAGFPFAASKFWQNEAAIFDTAFDSLGINDVENEFYNTRFHGTVQNDGRLYDWFITTYCRLLRGRDFLGLLDRIECTLPAGPPSVYTIGDNTLRLGYPVTVDGKRYSADMLFTIDDFYNLIELDPRLLDQPIVLGDLGAGWGRIGQLLLQANPLATYVVLDIPECLLISSSYLPRRLNQVSACPYMESRDIQSFDRGMLKTYSLWFLGSHQLDRFDVGAIDMFVNVASFQEMTPFQVNRYMSLFNEKLAGGFVYLRNLKKDLMCSLEQYQFPLNWERTFFRSSRFSEMFFEAGFRTS